MTDNTFVIKTDIFYRIKNISTEMCLGINGDRNHWFWQYQAISQYPENYYEREVDPRSINWFKDFLQWRLVESLDGQAYKIINKATGQCLGISKGDWNEVHNQSVQDDIVVRQINERYNETNPEHISWKISRNDVAENAHLLSLACKFTGNPTDIEITNGLSLEHWSNEASAIAKIYSPAKIPPRTEVFLWQLEEVGTGEYDTQTLEYGEEGDRHAIWDFAGGLIEGVAEIHGTSIFAGLAIGTIYDVLGISGAKNDQLEELSEWILEALRGFFAERDLDKAATDYNTVLAKLRNLGRKYSAPDQLNNPEQVHDTSTPGLEVLSSDLEGVLSKLKDDDIHHHGLPLFIQVSATQLSMTEQAFRVFHREIFDQSGDYLPLSAQASQQLSLLIGHLEEFISDLPIFFNNFVEHRQSLISFDHNKEGDRVNDAYYGLNDMGYAGGDREPYLQNVSEVLASEYRVNTLQANAERALANYKQIKELS